MVIASRAGTLWDRFPRSSSLLAREKMGEAWGIPAAPGERTVANSDEDSLTMAMSAGADCMAGIDPKSVDGVYFATTTSPYHEKQCAAVIAQALDMRRLLV